VGAIYIQVEMDSISKLENRDAGLATDQSLLARFDMNDRLRSERLSQDDLAAVMTGFGAFQVDIFGADTELKIGWQNTRE
jgi:hypothetical protein